MEIEKEINVLKKSIKELEQLVEELIASLEAQKLRVSNKEKIISQLKDDIRSNIEKIDEIIEEYHANT
ncbi:MAG: hypothetical protein ACJ0RE_04550 [Alphaproteobacteria bacterium]|tara:strand:- start:1200 stop:1403 length:204 start_codon:yes stop_codon:yes gene_type:complete